MAEKWIGMVEHSFEQATHFGRQAGLLDETAQARAEIAMKQFIRQMNGDLANVAIVANENAEPCRTLVEQPDQRVLWWSEQEEQ
ncbi:hypothetical protein D3C86_1864010 [compost metagenome]